MAGMPSQIQSTFTASPKNMADFDQSTPPSDFFLPHRRYIQGEQRLMLAVLEDAVACFQEGEKTPDRYKKRLAREAEEWMFADDPSWPFSFENVCAHLGFNTEYIRRGLIKLKKRLLLQGRLSPHARSKHPSAAYGRAMPLSLGRP